MITESDDFVRETDVIGGSCPQFEIAEKAKRCFQKLGDGIDKEHVAYERLLDVGGRFEGKELLGLEAQCGISQYG